MNCKPGDLALVVGPDGDPDVGRMVTCLRLYRVGEKYRHDNRPYRAGVNFWVVDRELHWRKDGVLRMLPFCPDAHLMPIRPEGDEDLEETERIAREKARRLEACSQVEWIEDVPLDPTYPRAMR